MTRWPRDREAREGALDPRGSFHLEAPAGSGKTAVLLARFLTLLGGISHSPREILVLTFTRKAAGEFRARAMQYFWRKEDLAAEAPAHERQLQELAQGVFRHFDRKKLLDTLKSPERLPITTFHAFCVQLLRAAPLEAGVPLDFQLLESDREAEWLKQEALEELRRRLSARPAQDPVRQALVKRLLRLNNRWPSLARELRDLLSRRDTLKEFLALAKSSLDPVAYHALMDRRLTQVLEHDLQGLSQGLAGSELGRRWPEFIRDLRDREAPLGDILPEEPPRAVREDVLLWGQMAKSLLTQKGELRKRWSATEGFPQDFARSVWPEVFGDLPPEFLASLRGYREEAQLAFTTQEIGALQDLILLLHAAWEVYDELCRHRRVMDFIAAEEAALRLLEGESPGELLLRLDWRLQHILVDEFQDTSDNQKGLLCRLLAGWEAGGGRTLTVVGDPKQSIYGWRQARLRLFLESREGLRCGGGQTWPLSPLSLTTNFRATKRLIQWVNGVFGETVMADAQAAGGLVFKPADPPPGQGEGADPVLALFAGEDREAGRRAEARWLAQQVAEAQEELPAGEKVALLLFARTHLTTYLGAFQEIGLVPRVKEGLKLADSRVVQHLHNLARALVRPQDDVAWATLLAGPWVRPDLVSLAAGARTPGAVWPEKLLTWAGTDACPPELAGLINNLHKARERVGREPLVDTVERFLGEVGGWEGLAAWEGALGVAGVRAYLRLLAGADLGLPEGTFEKADFALEGAYLPPDPRAEDSRVEVLTVHGAKGLEFHTVFLPYLDWRALGKGGGQPPFLLEEIPGTGTHALALAPPQWQKRARSSFTLVQNLHNARLLAEARRVFYVAVTRARARLFLSGVLEAKGGGLAPPAASPLSWLWQHYRVEELPGAEPACWEGPPLRVECWAEYPEASPRRTPLQPQPQPWEFVPESPAYGFSYPSREAVADPGEEGARPRAAGPFREGDNQVPRVRGEVTHRLLETLVRGAALPGEAAVAAALRTLGLTRETAARLAPDLLAEVESCSLDPFLGSLLASGETTPEWFLEDRPAPGVIRRGRLDLLAWDGQEWWLVDFKTSRPPSEEDWEGFVRREAEKYRPQLLAYREMAARAKGIEPPEVIRVGVYFTAWRKVVEV